MRPVSDYPFDKNKYKYILQKKQVDIIITQELHKKKQKTKTKKTCIWGKNGQEETELTQNRQEQAWWMKYLLTEIKWMNIKVKINS